MESFDWPHYKSHVLDIYIKQLELEVEKKTLVNFVWKSDRESYTSLNVLLHPGLSEHIIDQKLTLHHSFKSNSSSLTQLKLYDVTGGSHERLLGDCDVDLKKLLNVTNPVKFKLINEFNDPIPIHTYVTTSTRVLSTKPYKSAKSAVTPNSALYQKRGEEIPISKSMLGNTMNSVNENVQVFNIDESDIYNQISKMSLKLSSIEKEIMKKTLKLNEINKENVSEMTKIKSRLEKDLMKKDLQIKILITQLDELHTSLALSHQRELELSNRVEFGFFNQNSFTNNNPLNTDDDFKKYMYNSDERFENFDNGFSGYNKNYMDELETNINDLQRFKQDFETLNDPGAKINKCKEIIHNLERIRKLPRSSPRSVSSSSEHSSNYQNRPSVPLRNLSHNVEATVRDERPVGINTRLVKRSIAVHNDRIPMTNRVSMEPGSKTSPLDNNINISRMADLKTHSKRMPFERPVNVLQVPKLIESREKSSRIYGGGVFIPNTVIPSSGSDTKSVSNSVRSGGNKKFESSSYSTINGLERELVDTKVKLADSETTKEVYYSLLLPNPPKIIA
ncbi:hypothetical protein MACJ_003879 [Theileria orientalis]|uniref:Uncharacterized protein n=1 Tax=Theileria orientalis TaxID=68886 RepID=A0A976SKJ3_THEOR|nr:hypothetical protein MACJ_003879 [Theileria orientalis]